MLTVVQLRKYLKELGRSSSGNKEELVARLCTAVKRAEKSDEEEEEREMSEEKEEEEDDSEEEEEKEMSDSKEDSEESLSGRPTHRNSKQPQRDKPKSLPVRITLPKVAQTMKTTELPERGRGTPLMTSKSPDAEKVHLPKFVLNLDIDPRMSKEVALASEMVEREDHEEQRLPASAPLAIPPSSTNGAKPMALKDIRSIFVTKEDLAFFDDQYLAFKSCYSEEEALDIFWRRRRRRRLLQFSTKRSETTHC